MGPDQENSRPHGGMLPFALDLRSFAWRRGAFRNPAAHVAIPAARQRPGKVKLAGQWLLVGEGTPLPVSWFSPGMRSSDSCVKHHNRRETIGEIGCLMLHRKAEESAITSRTRSVQATSRTLLVLQIGTGGCLTDVHRLHLPTLTWRGPLPLHAASAPVQSGGGFTAQGLVSAMGVSVISLIHWRRLICLH